MPAGLFAHDLDITGVKTDGEDVEFEQRLSVYEQQEPPEGKQHAHAHVHMKEEGVHRVEPGIQQTPLKAAHVVAKQRHNIHLLHQT